MPRLYAILDAAHVDAPARLSVTRALLEVGVRLIQYRDKDGSTRALFEACIQMRDWVAACAGTLIVNDRADVAWAAGAGGVHLGQDDLPAALARRMLPAEKIIGVSTHSTTQVKMAEQCPVDYVAFGPVFATRSKERPGPETGLAGLRAAREATCKPLVAIGGITLHNARAAIENGADSVAVIHALLSAPDPGERARQFLEVLGA